MGVLKYLVTVILGVVVAISMKIPESSTDMKTIEGNGKFANNMYKVLSKEGGNVVFSPFSAHACLSMLYQGVSGPFLDDFAEVLKVPEPSTAAEGYESIMKRLNSSQDITLLVANKAFVGRDIVPEFKTVVEEKFHSEVEKIDFENRQQAANIINSWVKDKTQGKIEKLFEPADLPDAVFVLVNTVYFKGTWLYHIDKKATSSEPFFVDNEEQIDVDTMHLTDSFPHKYSYDLHAQILEMEYSNRDFSMVFILPSKKDGIEDLEAKIIDSDFNEIMQNMEREKVIVSLPKFKFVKTIELKPVLSDMGLQNIFKPSHHMDKVVNTSDCLHVSQAIQKVVIQVDEEGSEASAATGVIGEDVALGAWYQPEIQVPFKADHPFLFFLTHRYLGIAAPSYCGTKHIMFPDYYRNILFYGRVERPSFA